MTRFLVWLLLKITGPSTKVIKVDGEVYILTLEKWADCYRTQEQIEKAVAHFMS